MKGFIKTGNIITMSLAVMGIFASCGDSEIFDEPTMYQTRAAMNMNMRNENNSLYILEGGNEEISETIYSKTITDSITGYHSTKEIIATVNLNGLKII